MFAALLSDAIAIAGMLALIIIIIDFINDRICCHIMMKNAQRKVDSI